MNSDHLIPTLPRAIVYAAGGVACEVIFTGIKNPPHLRGETQIWVIPLYALGGVFGFEPLHNKLRDRNLCLRVSAYAIKMLAIEYMGGWVAHRITGECPWKYEGPYAVHTFINLAYFPLWCGMGYMAEKLHDYFLSLKKEGNF